MGNNKKWNHIFFLIAFHLSVPLTHIFIGSGIPAPWSPDSLKVRGLELISYSVICQLGASIPPMLKWCLNTSIRHPDLSDWCSVGSCVPGQNGRSLDQRQSAQGRHSTLPEEQQKFFSFQKQNQCILWRQMQRKHISHENNFCRKLFISLL